MLTLPVDLLTMFDKKRSRHQVIKVNCFFLEADISIRLIRIFQKCQSFSCFYRNIFHFFISTWYTWFLHLDVIDGLSIHLITYVWSWHAKNVSIISTGLNSHKHYGKVQLYFDIIWHIVSKEIIDCVTFMSKIWYERC